MIKDFLQNIFGHFLTRKNIQSTELNCAKFSLSKIYRVKLEIASHAVSYSPCPEAMCSGRQCSRHVNKLKLKQLLSGSKSDADQAPTCSTASKQYSGDAHASRSE